MDECVPFSMYLCIVLVCVSLNDCHVNSNPCVLGNCILPFFHLFVLLFFSPLFSWEKAYYFTAWKYRNSICMFRFTVVEIN